ncbi:MAG: DinB family protein [Desulfobacteraceae bacterium]|nr:MAG: DinB family protein [Desulfobacteraceae bacterium]
MFDIYDLLDGLRRAPRVLSAFAGSIPGDRLDLRRGEGFWTIAEHVAHLAQVQPMLLDRIHRFMNEDHPEFVPYFPLSGEEPRTPLRIEITDAVQQFKEYRNKQVALLENAENDTWKKKAAHPEYEQYSMYILARHMLMHDYWHMYRMEELWLTRDAYLTKM